MDSANNPLKLNTELANVSAEFLARYNRPGPRYTSFPTAPVWQEDFGVADLEGVYGEAAKAAAPVSLYMHLPFCESLCLFCACNVVIQKDKAVAQPYLETLKKEIAQVARRVDRARPVIQFHWGGGTPTYLTPEQMEELFGFTRERFTLAEDAEIGVEVDPRVTTSQHLQTMRKLGFNRLSMGVQDFNLEVQKAIHRLQGYELTRGLIEESRAMGYGTGYRYAHDHESGVVEQQHLPDSLVGHQYYDPSDHGDEREVAERLETNRQALSRRRPGAS